jgi:hypothetical protein
MSFAWTLFRDKILLNKDFAESMSKELEFKQIADGSTILLAANEFLLDPNYTLSYLLNSEVKFPGRYNLVIVADHFDSKGGRIDLSGSPGHEGPRGDPWVGEPGADSPSGSGDTAETGEPGGHGDNGYDGQDGMNVTVYCIELVDINIISNGGTGGKGGPGGQGGRGGNNHGGTAGGAGNGGPGGDVGKPGLITVTFCNIVNGDFTPAGE